MEVDEGSDQKSDIKLHWLAAHARLKIEFTDVKCHNVMTWLNCSDNRLRHSAIVFSADSTSTTLTKRNCAITFMLHS